MLMFMLMSMYMYAHVHAHVHVHVHAHVHAHVHVHVCSCSFMYMLMFMPYVTIECDIAICIPLTVLAFEGILLLTCGLWHCDFVALGSVVLRVVFVACLVVCFVALVVWSADCLGHSKKSKAESSSKAKQSNAKHQTKPAKQSRAT